MIHRAIFNLPLKLLTVSKLSGFEKGTGLSLAIGIFPCIEIKRNVVGGFAINLRFFFDGGKRA